MIEDHFDLDPEFALALEQAGNEAALADLEYLEGEARFFYTRQSTPKGLGDAISLAAGFVDSDDFVAALGDTIIAAAEPAAPVRAMMEAHRGLKASATIAVEQVPPEETFRYGIVSINGAEPPPGEPTAMTDIIEKPPTGTAPTTMAVAARYVFTPAIFEALDRTLPDERGELQLTDAIRLLIQIGKPVYAWLLAPDQRRYDVGNFESYFRTFVDFALADERFGGK